MNGQETEPDTVPPLDALIPHRPPMVLIDAVESVDVAAGVLRARVTIGPSQLFFENGGVPNWVAIEYMAQTAAALVGMSERGRPARPGLLLGTRRLSLELERFESGRTYVITVSAAFADADAAAFDCRIEDDTGRVVATATLNAYRPPDFQAFLKEQTQT